LATQAPLEQKGVDPPQAVHVAPAFPHEAFCSLVDGSQVPLGPPLQQPLGQVCASQAQVPLVVSHKPLPHPPQVAPAVPHEAGDWRFHGSHVPVGPPSQQPLGQEDASQVQVPLVLSHSPLVHVAHVAPAVPHDAGDSEPHGSHVPVAPPLQHPSGHDVPSHTHVPLALLHSRPDAHPEQLAPAVPHDVLDSDAHGSHVPVGPPLQQPWGHDVASQTHCPVDVLHSRPVAQGLQLAPPDPQDWVDSLESASHAVPLQQPAQAPPPQEHTPLAHAWPPPHGAHAAPPVPHDVGDCPV
jgi:hypothetical protein